MPYLTNYLLLSPAANTHKNPVLTVCLPRPQMQLILVLQGLVPPEDKLFSLTFHCVLSSPFPPHAHLVKSF